MSWCKKIDVSRKTVPPSLAAFRLAVAFAVSLVLLGGLEVAARVFFPNQGPTFFEERLKAEGLSGRPKPPGEKRVFVFGASSVVGYHRQGRSSLALALEAILERTAPRTRWRVINFGKPGENFAFARRGIEETGNVAPDLIVVVAGENELIPPSLLRRRFQCRLESALLRFKTVRLLYALRGRPPFPAIPDFRTESRVGTLAEGLQQKERIKTEFSRAVLRTATDPPAPTVFLTPLPNRLWGPSFHDDLDKLDLDFAQPIAAPFVRGLAAQATGRWADGVREFQKAAALDARASDVHFRTGECLAALGRRTEARVEFEKAFGTDVLPRVLAYPAALEGPRATVVDLSRTDSRHAFVDYSVDEDDIHPRVETELAWAAAVLRTPFARRALGLSAEPSVPPPEDYERRLGLDARFWSDVFRSVGGYHNGAESGAPWLEQARRFTPGDAGAEKDFALHRQKMAARRESQRSALQRWERLMFGQSPTPGAIR